MPNNLSAPDCLVVALCREVLSQLAPWPARPAESRRLVLTARSALHA